MLGLGEVAEKVYLLILTFTVVEISVLSGTKAKSGKNTTALLELGEVAEKLLFHFELFMAAGNFPDYFYSPFCFQLPNLSLLLPNFTL